MNRFVLTGLLLLVAASMLLIPGLVRADDDKESDHATLLVKVPAEHVGKIAKLANDLRGRAYDVDTLEPIAIPGAVEKAPFPMLGDVGPLIDAAFAAASEVSGERPVTLDRVMARQNTLDLKIVTRTSDDTDRFRAALLTHVPSSGFVVEGIEVGSVQAMKGGGQRTDVRIRVGLGDQPSRPLPALFDPMEDTISTAEISRIALEAGLDMIYASATKVDEMKSAGAGFISRDFTFRPCSVEELRAFLASVRESEGLYAAEVRASRSGTSTQIEKPTVKIMALRRVK